MLSLLPPPTSCLSTDGDLDCRAEEAFTLGWGPWGGRLGGSLKPETRLYSFIVLVPRTMGIVSGEALFQRLEIG